MTQLILWMIMSYGLMNIVVYGSIFKGVRDKIRELGDNKELVSSVIFDFISGILTCPMCFSTWGGFLLGLYVYSPTHQILGLSPIVSWFFDGILSSGAVWAINAIIEWFEVNRPKND